jgi:hypothetical protein
MIKAIILISIALILFSIFLFLKRRKKLIENLLKAKKDFYESRDRYLTACELRSRNLEEEFVCEDGIVKELWADMNKKLSLYVSAWIATW